jgi:hypothetical protein
MIAKITLLNQERFIILLACGIVLNIITRFKTNKVYSSKRLQIIASKDS